MLPNIFSFLFFFFATLATFMLLWTTQNLWAFRNYADAGMWIFRLHFFFRRRSLLLLIFSFGSRQRKSGTQRHWKYYFGVRHFVFEREFSLWHERIQFSEIYLEKQLLTKMNLDHSTLSITFNALHKFLHTLIFNPRHFVSIAIS